MRAARRDLAILAVMLCALMVAAPSPARGQPAGDTPPASPPAPDFLLRRPLLSLGVRGGVSIPREGSDLFAFFREQLTIGKGDFLGPVLAADVGFALTPRIDVGFAVEGSGAVLNSEYRALVDNNLQPIEQTTELTTVHLVGEFRYGLAPRGHEVSRLAWVPGGVVPYVGAGAGAMWYLLEQKGDFVDYADLGVFSDQFRSEGWAPTVHVFGGVELHAWHRLFVTVEARYAWADAKLDKTFVDFEPIDLAGLRTSAGVRCVF